MSYREALVRLNWLLLMTILQPFLFLDRNLIFRWASFEIPLKCLVQFFGSYLSSINGMATFGWCSTEKPALFTWPSHVLDRGVKFRFCSLFTARMSSRWLQ